jgi:putative MATE family efflux protein
MIIIAGLSLVLGLVGGFGARFIVRDLIGAKGEVATIATRYLQVMTAGSFSIYFLLQLTNVQRALGSAKTPVALLIAGNVLNVFLAVLFVFGPGPAPAFLGWSTSIASALHIPRMGMLGAAWATVIARCLALVPITIVLFRRFDVLPPKRERAPHGKEIRRIASIAWPSSAQFFLRILAMLFVNSMVARYFTTYADQTATTAMGLVFRLDTMALFVAMGWGTAAQTFVGQNLGAEQPIRAIKSGWITMAYDGATNLLLIALVFAYGEAILRVFDDDAGPVAIALQYLHVVAPSYLALGAGIVLGNAMAGAGATLTTFAIDATVILVVQVPLCVLAVVFGHGSVRTIFQCVAITNVVSAILYCVIYARGTWLGAVARTRNE